MKSLLARQILFNISHNLNLLEIFIFETGIIIGYENGKQNTCQINNSKKKGQLW